jgi:hypothetical protein
MRENRPYGSEGGVGESRSRPLSERSVGRNASDITHHRVGTRGLPERCPANNPFRGTSNVRPVSQPSRNQSASARPRDELHALAGSCRHRRGARPRLLGHEPPHAADCGELSGGRGGSGSRCRRTGTGSAREHRRDHRTDGTPSAITEELRNTLAPLRRGFSLPAVIPGRRSCGEPGIHNPESVVMDSGPAS